MLLEGQWCVKLSCAVTGFHKQANGRALKTCLGQRKTRSRWRLSGESDFVHSFTACHKTVNASVYPKCMFSLIFIESRSWTLEGGEVDYAYAFYGDWKATSTQFWLAWTKCLLHIHKVSEACSSTKGNLLVTQRHKEYNFGSNSGSRANILPIHPAWLPQLLKAPLALSVKRWRIEKWQKGDIDSL